MKDSAQELQRIQGFEIYGKELYQLALNTDSPVLIMIIGEFSTGKSTFINALVGKEVTTVNDTPTTAVITKLCYGAREQITVYFTDGRAEEHSFSELKVLTAESKTNHDSLHQAIEYVEVAMPIPILQRINIIDSPGLNADKQLHIETTKRYMDKADTVFWMFSATDSPGKQTELEAIKALSPRLKPIAIVNKIDDIDEEEEESIDDLLDNFKSRVRKEVSQVIGISAKLALEGKLHNQQDKIKESNIQAVFDMLEHTIIPSTDTYKMNSLLESLAAFVFHSMSSLPIEDDSMSYERQIEVKRNNRTIQNIESRIVAELLPYAQEQYSAGNLSAQMFLGIMTYYGVGIEKDAEQSIDLLESLPSFTSKDGALKEEFLYTHFKGTHEYPKMIYWLKKGADAGRDIAMYRLAECYLDGIGVDIDIRNAVSYLVKAYENGSDLAAKKLGLQGTALQITNDTLKLLEIAGEEECVDAQLQLFKYYNSKPDATSKQKALQWLQEAGTSNSGYAQFKLGEYFSKKHANDAEALKWFKQAFENNYPGVLEKICHCYYKGHILQNIDKEACYWYKKGAEANLVEAQAALGEAYLYGRGVTKDYTQAVLWLQKAFDKHHVEATYLLGLCYFYGYGVSENRLAAFDFLKKAAKAGYAPSQYMVGQMLDDKNNVNEAFTWYKKAAEQGVTEAEYKFGLGILQGICDEMNKDEAAKWLERAATKQHKEAIYQLCLLCHSEIQKSEVECFTWYLKGADLGHADVQCWVADCYRLGKGCAQDITKAIQYYNLARKQKNVVASAWWGQLTLPVQKDTAWNALLFAASEGDANAQFWLGQYYFQGQFVVKSNAKAVEYFLMATKQVHQGAIFYLGVCRFYGYGIERDYSQAFNCFLKAAQTGNPRAQYMVGKCYEYGFGITHDDAQAFSWYLKAAKNGIAVAQNKVGICYASGKGTVKSISSAEKWLGEACKSGNISSEINYLIISIFSHYSDWPVYTVYEAMKLWGEDKISRSTPQWSDATIELLRKVADKGNIIAEYMLCCLIHDGKVPVESRKEKLYALCSSKKMADVMYWQYQEMEPNNIDLLKESAQRGYIPAQVALAKYYYTQRNVYESFKWAFQVAKSGSMSAMYVVACAYWKGEGIPKNLAQAYQYFYEASNKYKEALYMVGVCKFNGWGTAEDKTDAVIYYRKASNQDCGEAQNALGCCYYNGTGVDKDIKLAMYWFEKAIKQGCEIAKYNKIIVKKTLFLQEKYRL